MTPASLIIVSRHRPAALVRALMAVAQMDHPGFEVIVVADPAGVAAARATGLALKLAVFDQANISAARNIGLGMAAAPVVAFLDDDAVPEPTWLTRLTAPFDDNRVTAAGGFVLGRSGLAWQWRAAFVDAGGFDHPFDTGPAVSLHQDTPQRAIKTQGTNCAFRVKPLLAIGGFDPGFRFYLEEADVNLRLAARGGMTAVVPGAVVHHGFAASARRRADRVPVDLTEIGHSIGIFTARHGTLAAAAQHMDAQRLRLLRHMVQGGLDPDAVRRLMSGLQTAIMQATPAPPRAPLPPTTLSFSPLPGTGPRQGCLLFGRARDHAYLRVQASAARESGQIVTVVLLSRGLRPHRHQFTDHGWWEQTGGRFGRAFRGTARFDWHSTDQRRATEADRLSQYRPIR